MSILQMLAFGSDVTYCSNKTTLVYLMININEIQARSYTDIRLHNQQQRLEKC